MQRVFARMRAAAANDSSVLIVGETGTGKELVARAIHYHSPRAEQPFVPVNCSAIPRDLFESELFGHRKGAFTGASRDTIGLVRAADRGTLFLDEMAEMPPEIQVRLLRVLQERRVRRVGDVTEAPVDVRFLAATGVPAEVGDREGRLRQDLFYRIGVITIDLPPLRERAEDIPFLAQHFLERCSRVFPNKVETIDPRVIDLLTTYPWPGNVRELSNVIESIFAMGASGRVLPEDLPEHLRQRPAPARRRSGGDRTGGVGRRRAPCGGAGAARGPRQQVAGRLDPRDLPHPLVQQAAPVRPRRR